MTSTNAGVQLASLLGILLQFDEYFTVERVPMAVNADVCKEVCAQLERSRA